MQVCVRLGCRKCSRNAEEKSQQSNISRTGDSWHILSLLMGDCLILLCPTRTESGAVRLKVCCVSERLETAFRRGNLARILLPSYCRNQGKVHGLQQWVSFQMQPIMLLLN